MLGIFAPGATQFRAWRRCRGTAGGTAAGRAMLHRISGGKPQAQDAAAAGETPKAARRPERTDRAPSAALRLPIPDKDAYPEPEIAARPRMSGDPRQPI